MITFLSADGRYIAFATPALLVPDDTNGLSDIVVRDRETEEITRVSVDSQGNQTTSYSDRLHPIDICPSIYPVSSPVDAGETRAGYTNMCTVVYFPGYSSSPSMSSDGRYVAFVSDAPNLIVGDERGPDIFVHDRQTGETSRALAGHSEGPIFINADGRYIGVLEGEQKALLYDREMRQTIEVAINNELWTPHYEQLQISTDGRYIIFTNKNKHQEDLQSLFIHDRQTDKTIPIATGKSFSELHQSAEGRYLTFVTKEKLKEEELYSLFSYDFQTEKTHLVSKSQYVFSSVQMSANGRYLVFVIKEPDSGFFAHYSIFFYDHNIQKAKLIAIGKEPSLSANGHHLVFFSEADNLVPDDTNDIADVFVIDLIP